MRTIMGVLGTASIFHAVQNTTTPLRLVLPGVRVQQVSAVLHTVVHASQGSTPPRETRETFYGGG